VLQRPLLQSVTQHSSDELAIHCNASRDITLSHLYYSCRQREHVTAILRGHEQEVCGLKWSPNGQQLASGGNDNLLHIWDASNDRPTHRITSHQAAVKALAWCPFQSNLLASGGGTADRCIKFTNTHTGAVLNSIDTASQVCALQWSRHEREILSSHGFSQNQLCLWKYPSMVKVAEFTGHTSRVLHMAQSPDGTTVVSAAADETLRFWRVFAEASVAQKVTFHSTLALPITRSASQDWARQIPILLAKLPVLHCLSKFSTCLSPACSL